MTTSHEAAVGKTLLALDTSTATLTVAVVSDGAVAGLAQSTAERNHSVRVVPEIKRLMAECGIAPAALDAVAVGQGPGSYTGVRIAVTVGKTLTWAWNKPLIGVSSPEALALGAWEALQPTEHEAAGNKPRQWWIVPFMDARRGQLYTARFSARPNGEWTRLDADGIRMGAAWREQLLEQAADAGAMIWFAGDTASLGDWAKEASREGSEPIRFVSHAMHAGAIGKLAALKLARGEREDVHRFVPNYTQLAEAEAKRLAAVRGEQP